MTLGPAPRHCFVRRFCASRFLALVLIFMLIFLSAGCNPVYVTRVSWEEAGILWRREKIEKILSGSDLDPKQRKQFELVLDARSYATNLGLKPGGSFEQYSQVDRDVLVWVLSATPKTTLRPYTWWYPFVGHVPYKGFFSKDEAVREGEKLAKKDYDFVVRPSLAYSTLGWFDDPLLSTLLRLDDVALVDTVFHELLHNTLWVKNYVDFNETLANFVGAASAAQFFESRGELANRDLTLLRWEEELRYARLLESCYQKLLALLGDTKRERTAEERAKVLAERDRILMETAEEWEAVRTQSSTAHQSKERPTLNNTLILASRVYLREPWLFQELWEKHTRDLAKFLEAIRKLVDDAEKSQTDPFEALRLELRR